MTKHNAEVFAQRLKILRTEILGLSVADFCERAEIAVTTYYNIINQKHMPRLSVVRRISQLCAAPEIWLLGMEADDKL